MTSPFRIMLTQEEADQEVWEFLDRVSRIARSDSFVYEAEYAFIDRSYLSRSGTYDEIAIAVQLRRKPKFSHEQASSLLEEFRRRRVPRVLKGGRHRLRLTVISDFPGGDWPFAILYQAPGAEPVSVGSVIKPPPAA